MRTTIIGFITLGLALGCSRGAEPPSRRVAEPPSGSTFTVAETTLTATFDAGGIAEPVQKATLSTRLMGSVTQVLIREGDRVASGAVLARIDARDVEAKRLQIEAGIGAAEAVHQDALTQAQRLRALYADSAATRYQLDQAETGLARAEAGLRSARAARSELEAIVSYADVRAPFKGIVSRRYVDPGAFVAPGSPVAEVQDISRLRISVSVPPTVGALLRRGERVDADIEGHPVSALVEGVVPGATGAVYTVNAIVDNPGASLPPGGAATLRVPQGTRRAVVIPAAAIVREGDLTGVRVRSGPSSELRWVKLGAEMKGTVEVLAGLRPGDVILVQGT
jgi:RND family efflux transporter MFP subunit